MFEPAVADAIGDLSPGDRIIVLTWFDRAARDVLRTRPGDDPAAPERGVAEQFAALRVQALLQLTLGELAPIRPLQPTHNPLESIAGGCEGRQRSVLGVVGGGREYRVQSGASEVWCDNLPMEASVLQLHVVRVGAYDERSPTTPPPPLDIGGG